MKLTKILLVIGLMLFITSCKHANDMHFEDGMYHENDTLDDHYDTSHDASTDSVWVESGQPEDG